MKLKIKDRPLYGKKWDFLLKEYEGTFHFLENNADRIHKSMRFFHLFNVAIVGLIGTLITLENRQSSAPLIPSVSLISPWLTALALLTAVFGVIMVKYLLKLRLRDIWCYNRMNFLRRIFLEGSADEAALFDYVNSPYGPITPYSVTLRRFLASDAGINLGLVASISTIWAAVAIFLWPGTITSHTFVLVGITCAAFIIFNVISVRKAYIQATKQSSGSRVSNTSRKNDGQFLG